MMIGPVFQLRYLGLICPCLEKPENEAARSSLNTLTSLPIRYHRKTKTEDGSTLSSAMSSVSGLFGGSSSGGGESSSGGGSSTYVKERATLTVMDTLSGPAIFVETEPDANAADGEYDEEGNVLEIDTRHRKSVQLKKIGKVTAVEGGFLGMGGGPSLVAVMGRGNPHIKGSGEELLRFNVLDAAGKKIESADKRDEIINKLMGLVEWDRRRRERSGLQDDNAGGGNDNDEEEEFENDEEVGGKKKGAPKGRAAKAAYFAKREIELTKQRREREKRKARYLEGSGGLKYTAIAMANKAEIT